MKIGILTGGGDCPGLNAVIRAIVRKGTFHCKDKFVGFLEGWRGVLENQTRVLDLEVVLGHILRGGTPTAFDRMLATRYGVAAIDLVHQGKYGRMVALKGNDITSVPISDAIAKNRCVPQEMIDVAQSLLDQ